MQVMAERMAGGARCAGGCRGVRGEGEGAIRFARWDEVPYFFCMAGSICVRRGPRAKGDASGAGGAYCADAVGTGRGGVERRAVVMVQLFYTTKVSADLLMGGVRRTTGRGKGSISVMTCPFARVRHIVRNISMTLLKPRMKCRLTETGRVYSPGKIPMSIVPVRSCKVYGKVGILGFTCGLTGGGWRGAGVRGLGRGARREMMTGRERVWQGDGPYGPWICWCGNGAIGGG